MIRGCSRVVRGLFQSCSGIVPELLFGVGSRVVRGCSRVVVRGLFQSGSGFVPERVVRGCSRVVVRGCSRVVRGWFQRLVLANSRYTHLEFCRHTFPLMFI